MTDALPENDRELDGHGVENVTTYAPATCTPISGQGFLQIRLKSQVGYWTDLV